MNPTHNDSHIRFRGGQGDADNSEHDPADSRHRRILDRIPLDYKNHFVAAIGEFVGTFMFLLFAFGGTHVVNTAPAEGQPDDLSANSPRLMFISLSFGLSLIVNASVFYRITGGLFNPAVAIGFMSIGAVGPVRGAIIIVSQLLGSTAAAGLLLALLPGSLNVTTELGGDASVVQGLFIEVVLTAQLVFTILMLAVEKHRGTYMAPLGIGLSLFITQLMGVYYTGGSVNPARSFGPAVATKSFPTYHWIYFVGPILGALIASAFYKSIKILDYETVNPGQDDKGPKKRNDSVSDESVYRTRVEIPQYRKGSNAGTFTTQGAPISRVTTKAGSYTEGPNMEAVRRPSAAPVLTGDSYRQATQ
ncbi:aquaporin-like protein [Astrocystis sublimbata]|nr:aquaporin-like protein [Astrocystis sublimbata]